ncbi:MAG: NUDIX domain-containing protein, partial [Flavobacteriaceae bacterium]
MNASVPVRAAATVMLIRETDRLEVLMVRRHHQIDFMSGAMVFPGGKVEQADADPRWAEHAKGWDTVPDLERAARVAAVREAFEESGVVIGAENSAASHAEMLETRKAIDAGTLPFLDFIKEQDIEIDIGCLTLFSRWRTPPIAPKRFDTFFFLAPVPADQLA